MQDTKKKIIHGLDMILRPGSLILNAGKKTISCKLEGCDFLGENACCDNCKEFNRGLSYVTAGFFELARVGIYTAWTADIAYKLGLIFFSL